MCRYILYESHCSVHTCVSLRVHSYMRSSHLSPNARVDLHRNLTMHRHVCIPSSFPREVRKRVIYDSEVTTYVMFEILRITVLCQLEVTFACLPPQLFLFPFSYIYIFFRGGSNSE